MAREEHYGWSGQLWFAGVLLLTLVIVGPAELWRRLTR